MEASSFSVGRGFLLEGLSVGAEDIDDLVLIELLHLVAGGSQVLTRVELTGLVVEDLADGCGHCKTAIGVDVDLADSALGGLAELLLGNTYCIGKLAAVCVDDIDILLGNRRGAVEDDREAGKLLLDLMKNVECEGRRYQTAGLGVAGALLGLELVGTMGSSDGDGEGVATGTGSEVDDLLGTGIVGLLCGDLILDTCENTELGLYGDIILVCIVDDLLGQGDVLLVGEGGSIDHDRGEAEIHAALAELEGITVVEMEADLGILPSEFLCILYCTFGHVAKKGLVRIVASALGNLKDDRGLLCCCGLDDSLELLHVVEVECGDSVSTIDCLCKHLLGVYKTNFLIRYHKY